MGVVFFARVDVAQLKRPLLHKEDPAPQLVEFEMAVVLAEVVDTLLREVCLDEKETITQRDERHVFQHEQLHRPHVLLWELLFKVGSCLKEQLH